MRRKTDGFLTRRRTTTDTAPDPEEVVRKREMWDFEKRFTKVAFYLGIAWLTTIVVAVGGFALIQNKTDSNRDRSFQVICQVQQTNAATTSRFVFRQSIINRAAGRLLPGAEDRANAIAAADQADRVGASLDRFASAKCESREDLERLLRTERLLR